MPKFMSLEMEGMRVEKVGTLRQWLRRLLRNQRGALLLETVVALTVFGVLGTVVLSSVQTSYLSKTRFDIQSEAENLIRNEMESMYAQAYKQPGLTYSTTTTADGFTVTSDALTYSATSTDIETVRVTIEYEGKTIKVFETIRANR